MLPIHWESNQNVYIGGVAIRKTKQSRLSRVMKELIYPVEQQKIRDFEKRLIDMVMERDIFLQTINIL